MSTAPEPAPRPPAIVLAAASLLLIVAGGWPPEIDPWSRAACQVLVAGALVALAAGVARSRPPSWITILLPLPVASVLLASCRARAVDEAAAAAVLIGTGLVGRALGAEARARRTLLTLLVTLGSLAALRAAAQHHLLFPAAAVAIREADPQESGELLGRLLAGRPSGPFALPAALGGFLALGLPAAVAASARPGRTVVRLAAAGAVLLQGYALILSRSVGALAAVSAGILFLLPELTPGRARRAGLILLLVALVSAGFFLYVRRSELAQVPRSDPLSLRAGNWGAAAEMIRDHPILGTGPGSFGTFYPRYLRPGMNETRYAHNSYLQIMAGWGLWTALPLLILLGAAARAMRRAQRARSAAIVVLAGAWTFLLHNLVDFTAYLPGVAIPAALLLGLGLADPSPRPAPSGGSARMARAAGALASLILGAALVSHGVSTARCAIYLDGARQAVLDMDVERAADEARRAARARPDHPDPQQFLAELILAQRMHDISLRAEGEAAAARAVAAEPEAAILHFTRALYYRATGETGAAYREQYAAHQLFPLKPAYRPQSVPAAEGHP